jgi:hypothetical protein
MSDHLKISLGFDQTTWIGDVELSAIAKNLPNINEYVLAPAFQYNRATGQFDILGYGLVHLSDLPTLEKLREMSQQSEEAATI